MALFDDAVTTAVGRALDSVALRQRVTADNIANVMTPGFKAKRVQFEQALASAARAGRPDLAQASVEVTGGPARADGNDVQLEVENTTLMTAGLQYQALAQAAAFKHNLLRTALRG